MNTLESLWNTVAGWLADTGIKAVVALIVLLLSFRLITLLCRRVEKRLKASDRMDKTLISTLLYALRILLKTLVVVCLVGYLGIDTGAFTALIASLGVCAGLAVNGALSNLAGGVLLLVTRPFRVDDYIEACGYEGTVEDIHIINTKVRTLDNKEVYIPNGILSAGTIVNYSEKGLRRLDHTLPIAYKSDFRRAEEAALTACRAHPLVLQEPAPAVRVMGFDDSAIQLTCRVWIRPQDYWDVYFDLLEQIKDAFDQAGVEIPYRQIDLHMK